MSTRTPFALGVLVLALAVPACGGSSDASPTGEDGGQDADGNLDAAPSPDATPLPIPDSGLDSAPDAACAETLAAWTAANGDSYPATFAAAQASCSGPHPDESSEITTASCGGYDVYAILGLGYFFYYDASTGRLVAVVTGVITEHPMCAGPSTFVAPTGCTQQKFCAVHDAGPDADASADSGHD